MISVKRRAFVSLALALSACGGSAAPSRSPHVATVEVPESEQPSTDAQTADPARQIDHAEGDFASCIRGLRAAGDVPGSGDDRALYDAALGAERAGDLMTARKTYFELIQRHPTSKLIPLAYMAFGEMFAAEVPNDPSKRELARQSFREVVKYPPPESSAYFYAWLRLGELELEGVERLSSYGKASEGAATHPSSPCAAGIADQARQGMVRAYVDAGAPEKAWSFFRAKLGDKEGQQALRELVRSYSRKNKRAEACSAAKGATGMPELASEACSP